MITLLTILHVVVCLFLIGIVLLQHGKGADIGATFGGSNQTVFGTDGPLPLLNKITTAGAIVFMLTSLTLAYNSAHRTNGSVMEGIIAAPAAIPQIDPDVPTTDTPLARASKTYEPTPVSETFPGTEQQSQKSDAAPVVNTEEPTEPKE